MRTKGDRGKKSEGFATYDGAGVNIGKRGGVIPASVSITPSASTTLSTIL